MKTSFLVPVLASLALAACAAPTSSDSSTSASALASPAADCFTHGAGTLTVEGSGTSLDSTYELRYRAPGTSIACRSRGASSRATSRARAKRWWTSSRRSIRR